MYKYFASFILILSIYFFQNTSAQTINDNTLQIIHTKIFVNDQGNALKFYTETLRFVKKDDVTNEDYRWLTVVQPDDQDGTELILELNNFPAAKTYQEAMFEQNIPATMFGVSDVRALYERLKKNDVKFTLEPTDIGPAIIAIFDDTCGNLIQIVQFN